MVSEEIKGRLNKTHKHSLKIGSMGDPGGEKDYACDVFRSHECLVLYLTH